MVVKVTGWGMKKHVALVTGATGGIGREFVRLLAEEGVWEIWAIARSVDALDDLRGRYGQCVVPVPADLTTQGGIATIRGRLEADHPQVAWLINNAGIAKMGSPEEFLIPEIEATITLNCSALAVLSTLCLPFMQKGSCILNVSSASAFQPVPYLNLYAATKAFERSYSRALGAELKALGITVTAVCPSWVDTDLLTREVNGRRVAFPGLVQPGEVAAKALRDARKGRDQSIVPFYAQYLHVAAKIFPTKLVMHTWLRMLKRYAR